MTTNKRTSQRSGRRRLPRLGLSGYIGLVIVAAVLVLGLSVGILSRWGPMESSDIGALAKPSTVHPLGTDMYGRDLLTRVAYGARVTLAIGAMVTLVTFSLGIVVGLVSAFYGGILDTVVGRITDALMAIPGLLLAIVILAVLGPGVLEVSLALSLVYLPVIIRVTRGSALSVRERMHVRSARAIGASDRRIIVRHIAPHVMGPVVVQSTFVFAHAILYEASLSFLGLGVQPPTPSWGNMVSEGLAYIYSDIGYSLFPSLAVTVTILGVNLLGDALRDAVDTEGGGAR